MVYRLRSLLLTGIFGFILPVFVIGLGLAGLLIIGVIPVFEHIRQIGLTYLTAFLREFGSGHPVQGVLVLGITSSLVGVLFDTYNFLASSKFVR
ncbi:MAG: hypothetical protein VKK04_00695 [Synechococcales bacterium]|nr:hypothetical protein [Synechococcales bacterium]